MKAVACQRADLTLVDLPTPEPASGQALVNVTRCGICGSDLHARHHADLLADVLAEAGYDGFMRSDQQVVFGHEFCGEVVDYGPQSKRKVPTGGLVVGLPLLRRGGEIHATGLSSAAPGAYAEHVLIEESLMFAVPNGVSADLAVLTEPMAIGRHAVRRSEIKKRDVAVVIGCGPIGLAVICMLKARGRAHGRRERLLGGAARARRGLRSRHRGRPGGRLAVRNPRRCPTPAHRSRGAELALSTMAKLDRLPLPWHRVWRTAERLGPAPAPRDLRVRRSPRTPRR